MERNDGLRNGERARAAELDEAESRRADRGEEGYTNSDLLVRDDSRIAGTTGIPADRDAPTIGDQVGEAAGGIGGVLAGAALGSLGGPIGTVIGGIAGAIGGWWTGRAISEAASNFSDADDERFRADYETRDPGAASTPDRSYDRVRPAYQLGYLASRNPEYVGRSFEDIEEHLERGWTGNAATEGSEWSEMRGYARSAYVRGAASPGQPSGEAAQPDQR